MSRGSGSSVKKIKIGLLAFVGFGKVLIAVLSRVLVLLYLEVRGKEVGFVVRDYVSV